MENAPSPWLQKVFELILYDKTNIQDSCVVCNRPYYWLFSGMIAKNLRLVCRNWNAVFKKCLVIAPIRQALPLPVCPDPVFCLDMQTGYVKARQYRITTRVYLPRSIP